MNQTKQSSNEAKIAMRVSTVSVAVNLLLSLFKLLAGIIGHSGAMISDAVHSASDVFSTFIVMIGVTVSGKKSDKEHPYGHERMECVASIILAVILAATGIGIGVNGIEKIAGGGGEAVAIPGVLALAAASCFHCGEGMDVLVYQGCGKESKFRRTDGGRLASQVRRPVFHRSLCGYLWSETWISRARSGSQRSDLRIYRESGD